VETIPQLNSREKNEFIALVATTAEPSTKSWFLQQCFDDTLIAKSLSGTVPLTWDIYNLFKASPLVKEVWAYS